MKLLISDANIIIDMETGGLIEKMFRLEYRFGVPDVLFDVELRANHGHLVTLGLEVLELQPDTVAYADRLSAKHRKAGAMDLMALALARQEQCPLLTGDKSLRQTADDEGVEVKGTIWLVGEMLHAKVISRREAKTAYKEMRESGRRLPWDEADKQLKQRR